MTFVRSASFMYIHYHNCIFPQQTALPGGLDTLLPADGNQLKAIEPSYDGVPPGLLRRMGKAVRMGTGTALPLLKDLRPDGIIIGTANGGMEDCIRFLNQIIDYDEGMLTPGNFVQSTPNAIAGQLGLMTRNQCYNITHVHRGLSFEQALLDAAMLSMEHPHRNYLVGAVDEIADYNYNIDLLGGWYKKHPQQNKDLYEANSPGSIAGEGAVMLVVNGQPEEAVARLRAIRSWHSTNADDARTNIEAFLQQYTDGNIPLLITGENGDNRLLPYYKTCEKLLPGSAVGRFKHMSGEYPTAAGIALWLTCRLFEGEALPHHFYKKGKENTAGPVLIYNTYKGEQHSLILLSKK